jgi:hypothetical protein
MWWASVQCAGMVQPGKVQRRSRCQSATSWAVVARRTARAWSRVSPRLPSTTGMTAASQASRRTASGASSCPAAGVPRAVAARMRAVRCARLMVSSRVVLTRLEQGPRGWRWRCRWARAGQRSGRAGLCSGTAARGRRRGVAGCCGGRGRRPGRGSVPRGGRGRPQGRRDPQCRGSGGRCGCRRRRRRRGIGRGGCGRGRGGVGRRRRRHRWPAVRAAVGGPRRLRSWCPS